MLDDQAEPLGPALEQGIGAAIAENHRGQRRPAPRIVDQSDRGPLVLPGIGRDQPFRQPQPPEQRGVQAFMHFAARHADPGRPWLTVSTMPLVLP